MWSLVIRFFFFFNDTATTEIYTLSLHDALPIWGVDPPVEIRRVEGAQRKWCRKTSVFLSREPGMPGNFVGAHQGSQVPFQPPIPHVGLLLRRCSGKGLHLAMTGEPRGFSRVAAGFSSYEGEFGMPLVLAQGSPIFPSSCKGKLGIALE